MKKKPLPAFFLQLPPAELQAALEGFIGRRQTAMKSHRKYLDRRASYGRQTLTDIRMEEEYLDDQALVDFLGELRDAVIKYQEEKDGA